MIWKRIPSFSAYVVNEAGDVKRVERGIRGGKPGKLMKPFIRSDGYAMFIMRRDNRSFHRKAHQLVAEAFLPAPLPGQREIRHLDGTRTNDHYSNLAWSTHAENMADMMLHGTRMTGEKHPLAKLTDDQVTAIREAVANGEVQRIVADRYGIMQGHVSRLVNRVRRA
jgi:hypothetical protein